MAYINCSSHEIRGAAWSSDPQDLNAAYRNSALSDKRYDNLGFRVGMTLRLSWVRDEAIGRTIGGRVYGGLRQRYSETVRPTH